MYFKKVIRTLRHKMGFTLIELMLALCVAGILTAIILSVLSTKH